MKYIIRLFRFNEYEVYEQYEFDHLPYMPRIGEEMAVHDELYIVTAISSSFDQTSGGQFMIDYTIREVCW